MYTAFIKIVMPSFSTLLDDAILDDWKDYYINYSDLKDLLEKFAQRRSSINPATILGTTQTKRQATDDDWKIERFYNLKSTHPDVFHSTDILHTNKKERYLALIEQEEICHVLDGAIENVEKLYLEQIPILQTRMNVLVQELQNEKENENDNDNASVNNCESGDFSLRCRLIGKEILELYAFVGANSTALRQILIRYDCLIRTLDGPPLGQWYIKQRRTNARKNKCFEAIFTRRQLILLANKFVVSIMQKDEEYGVAFQMEISQMEMITQNAEQAMDVAISGRWAIEDSIMHTLQYYFLAGSLLIDLKLVPSFIRTRGANLKDEMRYFASWRDSHGEQGINVKGIDVGEKAIPTRLKDVLTPSLMLNFVAQLFYMMNHYIIEPSSTQYISELGGNAALSGMLIGVTPWAALMSTFVYSLWSNRTFKSPLLCSAFFLTTGSFIYANALKFHSIPLAMIGRCLTGLGAPCGLNIRIIADTVSSRHRTIVSAIFVSSSALGMSLGPALAIALDYLNVNIDIPIYGKLILNGMTGPGYLMSILWLVYTMALLLLFEDEERIGLKEIAERTKGTEVYHPPSVHSGDDHSESVATDVKSDCGSRGSQTEEENSKVMNEATLVCMALKFIGKFVVEIFGCSVSLITMHRYDWTVKNIGSLSFVNGCLIIPISTAVGFLSQYYSDRTLLVGLLCMALTGVILLIDFSDFSEVDKYYPSYYDDQYENLNDWNWAVVGPKRYVLGVILQFCGLQAAQSITLVRIECSFVFFDGASIMH